MGFWAGGPSQVFLPDGPFVIQLDADGPPGGAPEERTVVNVDLSQPGAVAGPGDIGADPALPEPFSVESGDIIETDFPQPFRFYVHCGIAWLGEFNGFNWRTDAPIPQAWQDITSGEIEMEITMSAGDPPTVEAVANGATVVYLPTDEPIPGCD